MRRKHLLLISLSFLLIILLSSLALATPTEVLPTEEIKTAALPAEPVVSQTYPTVRIPDRPAVMYIKRGYNSRFQVFFIDLKYDYDLVDFEFYNAWCLDRGKRIKKNALHEVRIYNCYDPNIPAEFRAVNWNRVHYIINHKQGPQIAVQEAVWHTIDGRNPLNSPEARQMVKEASEKGNDYIPGEGALLGIICYPRGQQPVLLEYTIPPKTETVDIAPAFFEPVLATTGSSFPPFIPPIFPPIFPPDSPPDGPSPPDKRRPVPEPGSLLLLGCGLAGAVLLRNRWK